MDLDRVTQELRRRAATVHERVPCPRCSAPTGQRCRALPLGYLADVGQPSGRWLRHPHPERLQRDGVPLR